MSGPRAAPRSKKRSPREQPAAAPVPSERVWLRKAALHFAVVCAAICLLGLFSTEIADTDFWWHLKTGQYVVQQHSLPVPDPFAYTTSLIAAAHPGEEQVRHFNLTHEWVAQSLLYVTYAIGG